MTSLMVLQNCRTIQLSNGQNSLVDADDWPELRACFWRARPGTSPKRYASRTVYLRGSGKARRSRTEDMHRRIMGFPDGLEVDHRDGYTFNNTRSNLRVATRFQNSQNRRTNVGKSRFKGVFSVDNGWRASIRADGQKFDLGRFDAEEDAARAYDAAAIRLHGEFAATNAELLGDYGGVGEPSRRVAPKLSKFKGVWKHRKKWIAMIHFEGKSRYLGTFDTQEDAAAAYRAKAAELRCLAAR